MSKTSPTWLIDKSAYARLGMGPDDQAWADRIDRGLVRISTVTRLELGYSARTAAAWRAELDAAPLAAMPIQYLTPVIEDRAVEVQLLLADLAVVLRRLSSTKDPVTDFCPQEQTFAVTHLVLRIAAGRSTVPEGRLLRGDRAQISRTLWM